MTWNLAIFGGVPEFDPPRYIGLPNVGDRAALHALLDGVLDRRRLSNGGPLVQGFGWQVAEVAGVRYRVASATVALELARWSPKAVASRRASGRCTITHAPVVAARLAGHTPVIKASLK